MQKTKSSARFVAELRGVFARRFKQDKSPGDVGFDERRRIVNRTVYVGFRREIDHNGWLVILENRCHRIFVGNVGLNELHAAVFQRVTKTGQISGVSQFIYDDQPSAGFRKRVPGKVRADETRASGHDDSWH